MDGDWTPQQLALFRRLLRHMAANQGVFSHPGAPRLEPEHWLTVCHNAAWMAADMLEDDGTPYVHTLHGRLIGMEPGGQPH